MKFTAIALALLSTATSFVSAAPRFREPHGREPYERETTPTLSTKCSLSKARLSVPAGQTQLAPPNKAPEYLTVGLGVQNYTCQSGVWTSVGAVAALYDVSCFWNTPEWPELTQIMFDYEPEIDLYDQAQSWLEKAFPGLEAFLSPILHHFFVANPVAGGTGLDPRFNLQASSKYSTLKKAGTIPSPDSTDDVAWLELSSVVGNLATEVFRVETVKGQPATSCSAPPTQVTSIPYAAQYWFFS